MSWLHKRRRVVIVLGLILAPVGAIADDQEWEIAPNSTLAEERYADGDSFHVYFDGNKRRHYILRLYNIDTPESDTRYPDRLKDQGDYFDTSPEAALAVGKTATEKTRKWLSQPFTIYTLLEKAPGATEKPRYYGLIQCADGEFLSEKLVANGLARIYGKRVSPPTKEASYKFFQRLDAHESAAKKMQLGGWNPNTDAGEAVPQKATPAKFRTNSVSLIHSPHPPHQPIGRLPPGHVFEWINAKPAPYYRVRFTWRDGRSIEGLMLQSTFERAKKISPNPQES